MCIGGVAVGLSRGQRRIGHRLPLRRTIAREQDQSGSRDSRNVNDLAHFLAIPSGLVQGPQGERLDLMGYQKVTNHET